jgi:4-amino-4-deoxy-L-arabinose transferase-like glycosyltransferase
MLKKNIGLVLILILAIFLRFNKLDYLELFGDEIDAGYQAYSLLETGRDYKGHLLPLYAQSFSEWRAPMMMYFMIPFIKIFGLNEWGVRSFSAFFGVVSLLGFYFLMMKIGVKKKISLITAFLLAILPWHIQYSRSGFEITLMSSFIIWGIYFLIDYLNKNKVYKLFLSASLLSLSFYTYNTANVYVPLLLLLVFGIKKLTTTGKVVKPAFKLLVIMFLLSLPILYQIFFGQASARFGKVSLFNDDNLIAEVISYREQQNYSMLSKIFYNRYVLSAKKIGANYFNSFSSDFLFGMGDVTFRHSLHKVGNLFWVYLVFLVVGFVCFVKKKDKNFGDYFMLGFLIISPIPSSLTVDGAYHATRLFLMVFPLGYFAALGFNKIFEYKKIIGIALGFVLFFEFAYFQYYYWNSYKLDSWRWWQVGYKEMFQSVNNVSGDYKKVLIENTYEPALPRFLFWSQYNPRKIFGLNDNKSAEIIDGFEGFCLDSKFCFVNYGDGVFDIKNMVKGDLYVINHSLNVGGDWDWSKNPPEGITTLKAIKNPLGENLFYLVTKSD